MKVCSIDLATNGNHFAAIIVHHLPPFRDRRSEIPNVELSSKNLEDLFTEIKKYLEDCYDDW
jgi:hypothetical protein